MSETSRLAAATGVLAAGLLLVTGCGSGSSGTANDSKQEQSPATDFEPATNSEVCTDEATPLQTPYGDGFPEDWPFPPDTVVYGLEDRGDAGTIVSAISSAPFKDILDYMNNEVVDAGFEIESGETEEHDAEAEWRSSDFHGRWAIRESATCEGETTIQVLAGKN